MKFILSIIMCTSVGNTCLSPYSYTDTYIDSYDCLLDGYAKSIIKLEELGRNNVNEYGIYIKFDCHELIIPQQKPKVKA